MEETDDGTISCVLKCPLSGCIEKFPVLYKSYRSYYKAKKKLPQNQRHTQARWHTYNIEKHIRQCHGVDIPNTTSNAVQTGEATSPDLNVTSNPNEGALSGTTMNELGGNDTDFQENYVQSSSIAEYTDSDARSFFERDSHQADVENRKSVRRMPKKRAHADELTQHNVKRTRSRK